MYFGCLKSPWMMVRDVLKEMQANLCLTKPVIDSSFCLSRWTEKTTEGQYLNFVFIRKWEIFDSRQSWKIVCKCEFCQLRGQILPGPQCWEWGQHRDRAVLEKTVTCSSRNKCFQTTAAALVIIWGIFACLGLPFIQEGLWNGTGPLFLLICAALHSTGQTQQEPTLLAAWVTGSWLCQLILGWLWKVCLESTLWPGSLKICFLSHCDLGMTRKVSAKFPGMDGLEEPDPHLQLMQKC